MLIKNKNITQLLFYGFIFLFSLGQLQRIELGSGVSFYAHDLYILVWLFGAIVTQPVLRAQFLTQLRAFNRIKLFFAGWVVVGIFLSYFSTHHLGHPLLYLSRIVLYCGFGWLLWNEVKVKILRTKDVLYGFLFSGFCLLGLGFLQYILLPDTRFLFYLGWDDHYYRLISTLFDPGFTGIMLVLTYCLLQYTRTTQAFKSRAVRAGVTLGGVALALGIGLTYSRASYLAFALVLGGSVLLYFLKRNVSQALFHGLLLIAFIVSIPFLPHVTGEGVNLSRTSTVNSRTEQIAVITQEMHGWQWVTGRGLFVPYLNGRNDSLGFPSHSTVPDNWLIAILTGTGVVGLISFLWILIKTFKCAWRKSMWLTLGMVAVLFHGLFNATVFYPFVILFLWGMSSAAEPINRRR